ncbi:hypothetical protein [Nocardioides bizhenqiangii]|uniref:Lipoprotein n=1 Tax=Nocardioides bizhenqiangii TaxID=3095076 RepID=A0ABZ0ZLN2_9ACTN|nr:hypothetical protein [Nocardioides sp. HM61]WQQ24960.1 hypothetical protein SHK19_13400 [Nocardioides sp. HM61]
MRERRAIAGAGAALMAFAVAGCSGGASEDTGDVAIDDAQGLGVTARCVVADAAGGLVLYPGAFTAIGRTRLVSVVLDGEENLKVIEESVLDYRGPDDLQGVVDEYPPASTSFISALADWETRRPATGLVVRPRDGKQAVLVAVRLEDPGQPGHVRGVTIRARTPAGPRTWAWEQLVLAVPDGEACTPDVVAETTEWTG